MAVIKRYFNDPSVLGRIKRDFRNLIAIVNGSHGELSIQLRSNYFNIYSRGNSLAKIEPLTHDKYRVQVHQKFAVGKTKISWMNPPTKSGNYCNWTIKGQDAQRFLAKSIIDKLMKNIADVNHGEEIAYEQMLMTDNPPTAELVIIDRQVSAHNHTGQMDLLALSRPTGEGAFRFLVIEVKLGNNSELRKAVAKQLTNYVKHVTAHIDDYIDCYKQNYSQKRQLGLISFGDAPNSIEIERTVEGMVVVGGYSGIANEPIAELKRCHSDIKVKQIKATLFPIE